MGPIGYLLDTHTLLWAIGSPDLLPHRTRKLIEDPETRLWVSSASVWEMATKHRLGRLPEAGPLLADVGHYVQRLGADTLAISVEHARLAGSFPNAHRDPFDRMLAAQSILEHLPLMTSDGAFDDFPADVVR